MATKPKEEVEEIKGALYQSLNRNNAQIKRDRAEVIGEDLEMEFSRGVQDAAKELKRVKRERDGMYDFSPTDSTSLILQSDLDAQLILKRDTELSVKIRKLELELEIRHERYKFLFGKEVNF